ncbi:MAG: hypothetical protein M0018_02445 [Nitrospiraceae bacterium]|nr:hypothetical protein [Nitrospiraceae bacterium]
MKRTLKFLLLCLLVLIADLNLKLFGLRSDFASLMAFWVGYSRSAYSGIALGASLGLVEDSLGSVLIGPGMLSRGAIGFFAHYLSKGFFRWTPLLGFLGAAGLTFLGGMTEYASLRVFSDFQGALLPGIFKLTAQSLINGTLGAMLEPENIG